jgi:HK97 family phage prohead protease
MASKGSKMKELKTLPIEFDAKGVRNDGSFEGYASTFNNIDSGFDVVMPGAFTKSLNERPAGKVKMLWQHDQTQPIGIWKTALEDGRGLFVKGKILKEVQKGAEAFALMKEGVIDSMSIGYKTLESDYTKNGVRQLKELGLMEISLVTFPMNEQATVTGLKELNLRELENDLRDAGFSRPEAKRVFGFFRDRLRDAGGLTNATDLRDAGQADRSAELAAVMQRLESSLRA